MLACRLTCLTKTIARCGITRPSASGFVSPCSGRAAKAPLATTNTGEAILEQRRAEILRESLDIESLHFAAARALGHPAVQADPALGSMLRAFVSQREAELRQKQRELHPEEDAQSKLERAFDQKQRDPAIERERVKKAATRIRLRLEEYLAHYNVEAAKTSAQGVQEPA